MKKVEAIIRSSKFEEVREALSNIDIRFFTFSEVKGYGQQKGEHIVYRGATYDLGYIARLKLEILVEDHQVDQIVETIATAARKGEIGDGKITVLSVDQVVRIRTGEQGADALN